MSDSLNNLPGLHIPQLHRIIMRARQELLLVRVAIDLVDVGAMTSQRLHYLPPVDIDDVDVPVIGGRDEELRVLGEAEPANDLPVAVVVLHLVIGLEVVDEDVADGVSDGEELRVRGLGKKGEY